MTNIQRNKLEAINAIRDHYLNGTKLSDKHEAIRQRWSAAFTLLTNCHSIQQAIPVLKDQYGYSEASAYRDLNNAIRLFGNVLQSDKEGIRYIVYEYAMRTYQLAAKNGDYKAMAQAVDKMIKMMGLDRDITDLPDFEKLKPSLIVTVLPDAELSMVRQMLQKGGINLNTIEDAEYEILNGEGGTGAKESNQSAT